MNPNQNLQIPLFHTTYQYHWVLIRKRGPYWYDTGKSYALAVQHDVLTVQTWIIAFSLCEEILAFLLCFGCLGGFSAWSHWRCDGSR